MAAAPLPIRWEEPNEDGARRGVCPSCRRDRPLRLVTYWTNGARAEFRQESYNLNIGYVQGADGRWIRSPRYRDRTGGKAHAAGVRTVREEMRKRPELAGYADQLAPASPDAHVDTGPAVVLGALIVCPRCGACVLVVEPDPPTRRRRPVRPGVVVPRDLP